MKFVKKNLLLISLAILSLITRFAFLGYPAEVVFDEVHFGKFVSSYFTGEYYFDIHPPLGKLLIAGFAKICGYTPGFDFNHIGEMFDARNLLILRFLPAFFGALLPLVIYLILRQFNISKKFAFLGGLFVVFDNAILVESKFILVDSMLLFFGFFSVYLYLLYNNFSDYNKKILFLALSSFFAALSLSIKWTGVLFLGVIGLAVLFKYLRKFNFKSAIIDLSILVFIPIIIYYLIFAIHLGLLYKSGSGDAFMSEQFQNSLVKNESVPKEMPLLRRFIELNEKMYYYNSTLAATHTYGSNWYQWPFGKKPIWYWAGSNEQSYANIYLMGNIVEWLLVLSGIVFSLFLIFRKEMQKKVPLFFWFLLIGYFANLFPYIEIKRVTFLYHYLPSLLFGIIILPIIFENIIFPYFDKIKKGGSALRMKNAAFSGILAVIITGFLIIAPLSYGFKVSSVLNSRYANFLGIFLNTSIK